MARPFKYKTPDELREKAQAYFDWAKTHPMHGERRTTTDANGDKVYTDIQLPNPLTFEDLADFIGIYNWQQFAEDNRKRSDEWADVIDWIRNKIRADQIKGGLNGIYGHNIVCRLNGIAENMNINEMPAPQVLADEDE